MKRICRYQCCSCPLEADFAPDPTVSGRQAHYLNASPDRINNSIGYAMKSCIAARDGSLSYFVSASTETTPCLPSRSRTSDHSAILSRTSSRGRAATLRSQLTYMTSVPTAERTAARLTRGPKPDDETLSMLRADLVKDLLDSTRRFRRLNTARGRKEEGQGDRDRRAVRR